MRIIIATIISFTLLSFMASPSPGDIIYDVSWTSGTISQGGLVNTASLCISTNTTAATIVDSFNAGQNWLRIETKLTDGPCPTTLKANRSEVSIFSANAAMTTGEYFYNEQMYPLWQLKDPTPEITWQYHHPDGLSKTGPPPVDLWVQNGSYYIGGAHDENGTNTPVERLVKIGDVVPGQVEKWLLYYHRSLSSDGVIRVWRNSVLVFEELGPNANKVSGAIEPTGYYKTGIYKWVNGSTTAGVPSKQGSRVIYIRNIKVGTAAAVPEDFYPAILPPPVVDPVKIPIRVKP